MIGDKQYDSYNSWLIDGVGFRVDEPGKPTIVEEDK